MYSIKTPERGVHLRGDVLEGDVLRDYWYNDNQHAVDRLCLSNQQDRYIVLKRQSLDHEWD